MIMGIFKLKTVGYDAEHYDDKELGVDNIRLEVRHDHGNI